MPRHASRRTSALALTAAAASIGVSLALGALAPHARADDPATPSDQPVTPAAHAPEKATGVHARLAVETPLSDAPGKKLSMVHVDFDPGGAMAAHEHPGTVIVYVIAGAIRSQIGDGAPRVYHAGESWVELPHVRHALCENASTTEPAELVASLVADESPRAAQAGDDAPPDTLVPSGRHRH